MEIERQSAEIDDLLRSAPNWDALSCGDETVIAWRGRFLAVVEAFGTASMQVHARSGLSKADTYLMADQSRRDVLAILHQLRYSLRLKSDAPTTVAIPAAAPFEYFDHVRQLIESATSDLLFVDPYLDADFVARYLPSVQSGVAVRLLGSNKIRALASAIGAFVDQHALYVEVRRSTNLHDRFVFIDSARCYQSGGSFKDGAARAPSVMSQIVDAFEAMKSTYEAQWTGAEKVR